MLQDRFVCEKEGYVGVSELHTCNTKAFSEVLKQKTLMNYTFFLPPLPPYINI